MLSARAPQSHRPPDLPVPAPALPSRQSPVEPVLRPSCSRVYPPQPKTIPGRGKSSRDPATSPDFSSYSSESDPPSPSRHGHKSSYLGTASSISPPVPRSRNRDSENHWRLRPNRSDDLEPGN